MRSSWGRGKAEVLRNRAMHGSERSRDVPEPVALAAGSGIRIGPAPEADLAANVNPWGISWDAGMRVRERPTMLALRSPLTALWIAPATDLEK